VSVPIDGESKWVGPPSAEDALNEAKQYRLAAQQYRERHNATDWDHMQAERANDSAQTYALLSMAESLIELTRAVRDLSDRSPGTTSVA
jgi:hypothetical protein